MPTNPTAPAPLTDNEVRTCKLDLEQRRRADALEEAIVVDSLELGAAFEIIWLRDALSARDAQLREVRAERDRSRKHAKRLERDYGLLELRTENADPRVLADCTTIADALLADDRPAHLNFALCRDDNGKWDGEVLFSLFGPVRSIDLWVEGGREGHTICLVRDDGERKPMELTEHHDCLHELGAHLDWLFSPHSDGPETEKSAGEQKRGQH